MKRVLNISLILLSLVFIVSNCRRTEEGPADNSAEVSFTTSIGIDGGTTIAKIGDTLSLNTGYDFNLKKFKLYLSNITLVGSGGTEDQVIEDILLADVGDEETGAFTANADPGNYRAVRLGFGLDPEQNDQDPESFPDEHPLSSYNQMYWTMLKYRFAILEGRSDNTGQLNGDTTDILNAYHPGLDSLYQVKEYPISLILSENGSIALDLQIRVDEIFSHGEGIDMRNEPQTHSELGDSLNPGDFDIARRFMENLSATAVLELR